MLVLGYTWMHEQKVQAGSAKGIQKESYIRCAWVRQEEAYIWVTKKKAMSLCVTPRSWLRIWIWNCLSILCLSFGFALKSRQVVLWICFKNVFVSQQLSLKFQMIVFCSTNFKRLYGSPCFTVNYFWLKFWCAKSYNTSLTNEVAYLFINSSYQFKACTVIWSLLLKVHRWLPSAYRKKRMMNNEMKKTALQMHGDSNEDQGWVAVEGVRLVQLKLPCQNTKDCSHIQEDVEHRTNIYKETAVLPLALIVPVRIDLHDRLLVWCDSPYLSHSSSVPFEDLQHEGCPKRNKCRHCGSQDVCLILGYLVTISWKKTTELIQKIVVWTAGKNLP